MKNENTKLEANKIDEFKELITVGIQSWVKAGELIVQILDNCEASLHEISDQTCLSIGILSRFEQLGRKQIIPELLIAEYPASSKLIKLPYSEQSRLINGTVEVLTNNGESLFIDSKNLTPSQCKQVFSGSTIRDLPAQRAWIESNKRKSSMNNIVNEMPYSISGKEVIFEKGCRMKASQLLNILAQLTPKS